MRVTEGFVRRQFVHRTVSFVLLISVVACSKANSGSHDAATADGVVLVFPDGRPATTDASDGGPTPCGNGLRDPDEECDDGNIVGGDGCGRYCYIENGFICATVGQPCTWLYACGNRFLSPGEACDDGNTISGDGCAGDCKQVEPGWRCRVPGNPCVQTCGQDGGDCADGGPAAVCGNSIVEAGEECDDGDDPGQTPHNGDGSYGGCTSACTWGAYCGDGMINGPERCDDGAVNLDLYGEPGCTFACTTARYCGDGIVDSWQGEECDLGTDTGKDECVCTRRCRLFQCPP